MDTRSQLFVNFCSSCKYYIEGRKISNLICLGFDHSLQAFQNWAPRTSLLWRSAYISIMQHIIRVIFKLVPLELVRSEFVNLWRATSGSINARSVVTSRIFLLVPARPHFYMANKPHQFIHFVPKNNTGQTKGNGWSCISRSMSHIRASQYGITTRSRNCRFCSYL